MILIKKRRKGTAPGLKSLKENLEHRPRKILRLRKKVDSVLASVKKKEPISEEKEVSPDPPKSKKKSQCCIGCFESTFAYYLFWYFDGISLFGYRNHHAPTPHSGSPKCCDSRKIMWLIWSAFVVCLSLSIYNIEKRKSGSIRV